MTDLTSIVPCFVRAADVAHAIGVTRECIYDRVRHGALPNYELTASHTRGWSRTTLRSEHPDLWRIMLDYFSDKKAPN